MQYCQDEKPSTGKEVVLAKLLPATNYIFEVKAVAKRGDIITLDDTTRMKVKQDTLWQPKSFTTLPSTLDKPTLLNQTQHSILAAWKEPAKIAPGSKQLYYEVHYGLIDTKPASKCDTENEGKLAVTHSTTVELNSLLAGMKYRIKVRVLTTKGTSNWSEYLQASTEELKLTSVEKMRKSLAIIQMEESLEDAKKTLHFH